MHDTLSLIRDTFSLAKLVFVFTVLSFPRSSFECCLEGVNDSQIFCLNIESIKKKKLYDKCQVHMNLYSILKIIVKNKSYNPVYDMNDLKQKNCSGKIQELNYPCFVSMNIWTPILHLQNNLQFSWKYSKVYVKLWTLKCFERIC